MLFCSLAQSGWEFLWWMDAPASKQKAAILMELTKNSVFEVIIYNCFQIEMKHRDLKTRKGNNLSGVEWWGVSNENSFIETLLVSTVLCIASIVCLTFCVFLTVCKQQTRIPKWTYASHENVDYLKIFTKDILTWYKHIGLQVKD